MAATHAPSSTENQTPISTGRRSSAEGGAPAAKARSVAVVAGSTPTRCPSGDSP
jgi:hypothetical protein